MSALDERELRNVLGTFVTGVTVITTVDKAGGLHGCTANSFTSVSLDPPLVLWSQALKARSHAAFRDAERFTVNILAEDQTHISRHFATSKADKFEGVSWRPGMGGVPIIEDCLAYLECRKDALYPGGDHVLFLGQVESLQRAPRKPLVFGGGRYLVAYAHDMERLARDVGAGNLARIEAVRIATAALPEISARLGRSVALSVWGNRGAVTLYWELSPQPVSEFLTVGLVVPILGTATGLAFAAYLPREVTQGVLNAELAGMQQAGKPVPGTAELDQLFEETRANGVAWRGGSVQPQVVALGVVSFCAPVFDRSGLMMLGLTIVEKVAEVGNDPKGPLPQALAAEAATLSRRLGYQP